MSVGKHLFVEGEVRMAIWVLQVEEPPLQHATLPGTSLHYRGECIILREPQGVPWGKLWGVILPISHRQILTTPLLIPKVPGQTVQSY